MGKVPQSESDRRLGRGGACGGVFVLQRVRESANTEQQKVKEKVFAVLNAPDAEKNGAGELLLHGRGVYAWTTAVPGAPLKNGG